MRLRNRTNENNIELTFNFVVVISLANESKTKLASSTAKTKEEIN